MSFIDYNTRLLGKGSYTCKLDLSKSFPDPILYSLHYYNGLQTYFNLSAYLGHNREVFDPYKVNSDLDFLCWVPLNEN